MAPSGSYAEASKYTYKTCKCGRWDYTKDIAKNGGACQKCHKTLLYNLGEVTPRTDRTKAGTRRRKDGAIEYKGNEAQRAIEEALPGLPEEQRAAVAKALAPAVRVNPARRELAEGPTSKACAAQRTAQNKVATARSAAAAAKVAAATAMAKLATALADEIEADRAVVEEARLLAAANAASDTKEQSLNIQDILDGEKLVLEFGTDLDCSGPEFEDSDRVHLEAFRKEQTAAWTEAIKKQFSVLQTFAEAAKSKYAEQHAKTVEAAKKKRKTSNETAVDVSMDDPPGAGGGAPNATPGGGTVQPTKDAEPKQPDPVAAPPEVTAEEREVEEEARALLATRTATKGAKDEADKAAALQSVPRG
jgi:hypothetical protein